jgi:hypothetical protein
MKAPMNGLRTDGVAADHTLIREARAIAKDWREPLRDRLDSLIDSYVTACDLSRGLDPERSRHWRSKAIDLELQLRKVLRVRRPLITLEECHGR